MIKRDDKNVVSYAAEGGLNRAELGVEKKDQLLFMISTLSSTTSSISLAEM